MEAASGRVCPMERVMPLAAREWVEVSCAAQGVPVKVTDRPTLRRVAALLREPTTNTLAALGMSTNRSACVDPASRHALAQRCRAPW
jgi:hypothetical protein